MRVAPIAAVAFVALAAGCGANHGPPNVKGKPFPSALARLRADGWLVTVPSFPSVGGSLEAYRVDAQRTSGRRTVTLRVGEAPVQKVVLKIVGSYPPPVPRLVGRTYRNAYRAASRNGIALSVTRVEPLRPAASADGIDAFVVLSQRRQVGDVVAVRLGERPCWKTVVIDWLSDLRLDRVYERRCYREALRRIPGDHPFSKLPVLLQRRLRQGSPS
jgi:hypothetical protein